MKPAIPLPRRILLRLRRLHAGTLLLISYMSAIGLGSLLLMLPFATVSGTLEPIDALFTATSAVCVTGLIVVDTGSYFTLFGQWVILALFQLGGLGIMTISVVIFRFFGRAIGYKQRAAMQDVFAPAPRKDIYSILKSVILFTVIAESIGTVLLFIEFIQTHVWYEALYSAVFHSVSAFCNAGFSLYSSSFMEYDASILLNLTIGSLIVAGGLGFPVVYELLYFRRNKRNRSGGRRLSVQTKTVLWSTAFLIVFGMAVLWNIERTNAFSEMNMQQRILSTLFQSITTRTAGFNTVDIASLSNVTLLFMMFLMFVGASPGGTGGGIKTTTFALLTALTLTRLRHKVWVNIFKRTIPAQTINKAVSLVLISLVLIFAVFFLMLVTAPESAAGAHHELFVQYIFEVVSAFGTVGLSMGITSSLSIGGKLLIVFMMLIGRVGVLTFSYVLTGAEPRGGLEHAEENIMIG